MAGPIRIAILGNAASGVAAINTTAAATTRLGTRFKSAALAAAKFAAAGAAVGAGLAAYGAVKFAEAAVEDQKAAVLMAKAFKNAAGATGEQIAATEKWITAQGEALGVADDQLRPALSKLVVATGDVGKAQEQVSLAMDVAAGRGKTLEQVSEALAKAQGGNIGGLGRLGIATKNAAGETKTLAQITEDLAKKYKGSAAAAADTAAGKFERVKLRLSETGESIGYKLLPVITDLGDLLLTKGVPAVEALARAGEQKLGPMLNDLRGWFSENKDELRDLAAQITDVAIPAIKGLAGFVGDAVSWFAKLPGPIKQVGVEAGIAAVAVPRLASTIDAVTTSVGVSTTKLAGWRKGLLLAAGAGGLIAISEGASKGNKAVSLLGATMTGAFVGGTLGSAIPGVGTAIGAVGGAAVGAGIQLVRMGNKTDQASESAQAAKISFDDVAASLNEITGAADRAVKKSILLKLQQDGVVESASLLGIATSDLIKASLGNEKAIARVSTAYQGQDGILAALQNRKVAEWVRGMGSAFSAQRDKIKATNAALDGTDRSTRKANDALQSVGKKPSSMNSWMGFYTGDLNTANRRTKSFGDDARRTLSTEPGKARADFGPFKGSFETQLAAMNQRARTGGLAIGNAMESGVTSGLGSLLSNVVSMVNNAIAAARSRAQSAGTPRGGANSDAQQRTTAGRVAERLGGYTAGRYADGIAGASRVVEDAVAKVGDKAAAKLKEKVRGIRDQLASARSEFASLVEPISTNFTQGLFDFDSASAFTSNLTTVRGTLTAMIANFKKLIGEGLSPAFLYQLFQQGGPALINDLASLDQASAQAVGGLYSDVMSLSGQLGTAVAGATDKGAALEEQTRRLEKKLDKLTDEVKNNARTVTTGVTTGVSAGVNGAGTKGRRNKVYAR